MIDQRVCTYQKMVQSETTRILNNIWTSFDALFCQFQHLTGVGYIRSYYCTEDQSIMALKSV